jgi:hypothetical protein
MRNLLNSTDRRYYHSTGAANTLYTARDAKSAYIPLPCLPSLAYYRK